jgi:hypothetical protein
VSVAIPKEAAGADTAVSIRHEEAGARMKTILIRTIPLAVCLAAWTAGARAELKPGMVLNQDTWQQAEGLLPPEILAHYKNGEYSNAIVEWKKDHFLWPPDFLEASKENEGKYDVDENGGVIDPRTGVRPEFILGFPFPVIDPDDPRAGVKVVWNFFYRTWYFGNVRAESQVNWLSEKELERRADVLAHFMYYDGVPLEQRPDNPGNLLSKSLAVVVSPADLNGTAALTWRYRDAGKRDSTWSFVPALRRVRAVSPANRSDGFLGSDISQDDGQFFDGKPEDFIWTLKGKVEELRLVDPMNLKGKWNFERAPDGLGWRPIWADVPFIGYMDPSWSGLAWAPTGPALALREDWVVEGVPRDKYYLFGKVELHIDALTFQGAWNRKFTWNGELVNSYQVISYTPVRIDAGNGKSIYLEGSNMGFQCNENIKYNRATIGGIKSSPRSGFDFGIKFDPLVFDVNSLSRYGK